MSPGDQNRSSDRAFYDHGGDDFSNSGLIDPMLVSQAIHEQTSAPTHSYQTSNTTNSEAQNSGNVVAVEGTAGA
ncbi:hypothetical protein H2203_003175 [Taxawa tesnikishii (nom. ined.)]|nr:hypothetical protein H2203_003175 [Dothideales sp. JES 119]